MHGEKFSSPAALHGFLSRLPGCDQDDGERISLLNGASVVGQPPPPYYGGVIAPPYEDKASTVIDIHKRDWKPCQKKRSYESTNWCVYYVWIRVFSNIQARIRHISFKD